MNKRFSGTIVATAVAGLFLAGRGTAQESSQKTQEAKEASICCEVKNACSGKSGCASKNVVKVPDEKACTEKGGQVVECPSK